jgi:hypothetical protein
MNESIMPINLFEAAPERFGRVDCVIEAYESYDNWPSEIGVLSQNGGQTLEKAAKRLILDVSVFHIISNHEKWSDVFTVDDACIELP